MTRRGHPQGPKSICGRPRRPTALCLRCYIFQLAQPYGDGTMAVQERRIALPTCIKVSITTFRANPLSIQRVAVSSNISEAAGTHRRLHPVPPAAIACCCFVSAAFSSVTSLTYCSHWASRAAMCRFTRGSCRELSGRIYRKVFEFCWLVIPSVFKAMGGAWQRSPRAHASVEANEK